MKNILIIGFLLFSVGSAFGVGSKNIEKQLVETQKFDLHPEIMNMTIGDMLDMSPKDYRRITGERLGIKNAIKMKVAQRHFKRKMRKKETQISSGLYVLLAILGFGWLAMGIISDWDGDDWIINLILTLLCWLPGLIHALVKKSEYV